MYIYRSILQYEYKCQKFRVYSTLCVILPHFMYKNVTHFHEFEMHIFVNPATRGEGGGRRV